MDSQIALALIASLASLAVAIGAIPLNYLIGKRLRREHDLDMMSHYRDPLLQATADLRSRLVTILAEDFLGRFFIKGKEEQKIYAVRHTLFVFAEFLCWIEVLRQGVSFLDLGDDAEPQADETYHRHTSSYVRQPDGSAFLDCHGLPAGTG